MTWTERRRSLFYPALMSLGVSAIASCAQPLPRPQTVAVRPAPTPRPEPPAPRPRMFPVPAHKPVPPALSQAPAPNPTSDAVAMAAPEPVTPAPATVALPPRASELIGLDQPAAKHLFGPASEQADVPPATVWRYRNATCELDLFFYLDLRSGKMRTLHYSFKGEAADPAGRQDCLRSLIVARGS